MLNLTRTYSGTVLSYMANELRNDCSGKLIIIINIAGVLFGRIAFCLKNGSWVSRYVGMRTGTKWVNVHDYLKIKMVITLSNNMEIEISKSV